MDDKTPEIKKQVMLTGFQPTGIITLGNYLGAVRNCTKLQNDYNSLFFIADLHSLTVRREASELRQASLSFFAQLLSCGLDPKISTMFFQSHVPEVSELSWILNCFSYVGEMSRMTQFKDKSAKHSDNINMGLMDYPVLMASDILLYQSALVPVGVDQKQHLELARNIAERFNNLYGDVFTLPEGYIPPVGAKIYSLQDPLSKMSKSDPDQNATVSIIDDVDTIMRKFKRAVTDSGSEVLSREDKPGVSNLITIYSCMTGKSVADIEKEFDGRGYGDFKTAVGESVAERFKPIRDEYQHVIQDKDFLASAAKEGEEKARSVAYKTLRKVKKKVGLVQF